MKQTRAFFNRFSIGVTALWLLLFALLPNIGLLVVTVLTRGEQDFVLPQFMLSAKVVSVMPDTALPGC